MKGKVGHFIMIKSSVHQEYIVVENVHSPNSRVINYTEQILIEIKEKYT